MHITTIYFQSNFNQTFLLLTPLMQLNSLYTCQNQQVKWTPREDSDVAQQAHNLQTTLYLRRSDVMTSQRR